MTAKTPTLIDIPEMPNNSESCIMIRFQDGTALVSYPDFPTEFPPEALAAWAGEECIAIEKITPLWNVATGIIKQEEKPTEAPTLKGTRLINAFALLEKLLQTEEISERTQSQIAKTKACILDNISISDATTE